jgi:exoribonuclease-2
VRVRVTGVDLLTLDAHASLLERLDTAAALAEDEIDTEGDDAAAATPLALAIDVDEAAATPAASA